MKCDVIAMESEDDLWSRVVECRTGRDNEPCVKQGSRCFSQISQGGLDNGVRVKAIKSRVLSR